MIPDLCSPVEEVAPRLLGSVIRHGPVAVRLTELEAYDGATDPASHAYRGRTTRNAVMFGPPGHLYLYFTYGMHWAGNISCGPEGVGRGVLMRAGEVIEGIEVARSRRGRSSDRDLARGPGRLTQALGLHPQHKGCDLLGDGPVRLDAATEAPGMIMVGPRVGVSVEADRPWRFWIGDDRFVSDYKRSPRAPQASVGTPIGKRWEP
ncbi:MAG: DNA-3-methyladenine glycosylase [Propionibacteriaceae bacterium]